MERAGLERTIFYRHFDDLGDLLLGAGREAIEELYAAQVDARPRPATTPSPRRCARRSSPRSRVYRRHGPLLRALSEARRRGQLVAAGQEAIRRRFDELVADALRADRAARPAEPLART